MQSKATKVITRILAALLSVLLVLVGITLPLYASLSAMLETKTLVKVVKKLDVKEFLKADADIDDALEDSDLSTTLVDALSKSAVADELLEIYTEDISNALEENGKPAQLDKTKLLALAEEHMDELYELAKIDMTKTISKEDFAKRLRKELEKKADDYLQSLPKPQEVKELMTSETVSSFTEVFANQTVIIVLAVATALFAGLVYLCRFRKGKGFFWLMIDAAVCGGILLILYFSITNTAVTTLLTALMPVPTTLVSAVVSVYGEGLLLGGLLYIAAMALCLAAWLLCRRKFGTKAE